MRLSFILFITIIQYFFISTNGIAIMSIDFGNEFMKIAIVKPGVPMEIVLNKESRRKTPIAVSLKSTEREFGENAMNQAIKQPKTTYFHLKDLLGKSLDHPAVKLFQQRFPYYDLREDTKTKTVYFQHDSETTYTPEELIAMIFEYAKELATDFAEQTIDTAVITVPPFFTQAERKALLRAAELAKLNVVQLMNTNTAVGMNYGTFRRKDFNTTGTNIMFYDMGSSGTVASVVQFQMVKNKDDTELNPQLTVKGVGYDSTLGGSEFTSRLLNHFATVLKKQKNINLFDYPKAVLKLRKESERVKIVLSANVDHIAQVENLVDNIDFKSKITREEFENMCSDLFERVKNPVNDALTNSGLTLDEIESIIIVGGGLRIPKVQDEITNAVNKKELGKSLNADEAAALGAVYQAAYQSKGFKVKKITIKDLNMFPIIVDFDRYPPNSEDETVKSIRRVLYDKNNSFPQKKTLTLNKHDVDFAFTTKYTDMTLDQNDLKAAKTTDLFKVDIKGVKDAFEKYKDYLSKGLRIHFSYDDSGILRVEKVDITFQEPENKSDDESTLSKIGNTISSFFSGSEDESEKNETLKETEKTPEVPKADNNTTTDSLNSTETAEKANATKTTPKANLVKENLSFQATSLDYVELDSSDITTLREKLNKIREKEQEVRKRASSVNALETFVYDTKAKLEENEYQSCLADEERENMLTKLNEMGEWILDVDDTVETKTFKEKLNELKALTKDYYFRINEKKTRPKKLDELKDVLNVSSHFLASARNMSGENGTKPFTPVEVTALEKLINETKEWRITMLNEQAKLKDYDTPKLLTADLVEKTNALKREVSYLINKAKYFKPKTTTTKKPKTENAKSTSEKDTKEETKEETTPVEEETKQDNVKDEGSEQFESTLNTEETRDDKNTGESESTPNPEL